MNNKYFCECFSQFKTLYLLLFLLAIINGCSTTVDYKTVPTGIINTPGLKIVDNQDTFTLYSGKEFVTPFNTDCSTVYNPRIKYVEHLKDAWGVALLSGGRNVLVYKDDLTSPLHGVLSFCSVNRDAVGPASRSYMIQVPQNYIDATTNGGVSVVYEIVSNSHGRDVGYGWILWLSDHSFPSKDMISLPR